MVNFVRGVAGRINAEQFRADQRDADNSRDVVVHGKGDRFEFASPERDEEPEHRSGGGRSPGSDNDDDVGRRPSRDSLHGRIGGEWRDNTIQLVDYGRSVAGRINAEQFRADQRDADNSRDIVVHSKGDGFEFASPERNEEPEHRSGGGRSPGSDNDDDVGRRSSREGLYGRVGGEWRDNTIQLVDYGRSVAGRINAEQFRADQRDADNSRDIVVHGKGDRFEFASPERDEEPEHRSGGGRSPGSDNDDDVGRRRSRDGLHGRIGGEWWDNAVQLVDYGRSVAGRIDAEQFRADQWDADNSRDVVVHGKGDRFEFASPEWLYESKHRSGSRGDAGGDNDDGVGGRPSRDGLHGHVGGEWWDNAIQLVDYGRSVAGRIDAEQFRADQRDADNSRDIVVHGKGDRFEFADEHGEPEHRH
jgi:hypothetical protein